jgi:transposase
LDPVPIADRPATLVVFEICDISGWVYDHINAMGFAIAIANPSAEAWRWTKIKRKTDRDDALKLAKLASMNQLPTVHMPTPQQRQKRRLVHHRRSLVQRRTASKNQVRSIFNQQGIALPRGTKCWTKAGIEQLRLEAKKITECDVDNLWRGRIDIELMVMAMIDQQIKQIDKSLEGLADEKVKLLMTVDGVGIGLAQTVVVHLDDPHRFKSAGQVGSYAGLTPRQSQSGETDRNGHITRRGPSLLRGMLIEVAWMVYRHNQWAKDFVNRVSRDIKRSLSGRLMGASYIAVGVRRIWLLISSGRRWGLCHWHSGQVGLGMGRNPRECISSGRNGFGREMRVRRGGFRVRHRVERSKRIGLCCRFRRGRIGVMPSL